jgi:acetyl esterase
MSPLRALGPRVALLLVLAGCAARGDNEGMPWFTSSPESGGGRLDPKVRAALDAQGPVPEYRSWPLGELRTHFDQMAARLPKLKEPLSRVEDRSLERGFRIRIYTPQGKGPFSLLVYFHGGGWVLGDLESHDDVCRSLSRRGSAVVISADYARAPEARFPRIMDDCEAALRWSSDHARELNADPARLVVAGDSAGGNLAAGLALRVRDHGGPAIAFQLLIYPVTERNFETASYREFATGYGLTQANMRWFWDCYLKDPADAENPEAAPLKARDLKGLPPALVISAEFDVLRDETEAYAKRLHEAGVRVSCVRFLGMNHGFLRMGALFPQADRALSMLADSFRVGVD